MRVLFVGNTRIGDFILSSGLLRVITETYPDARITLAIGKFCVPLTAHIPKVERIIPMTKRKWNAHWFDLWRDVAADWDLVVDLRNSLVSRLVRSHKTYRLRRPVGAHKVVEAARVMELDPVPAPKIWLSDQERDYAAQLLRGQKRILALGPGAGYPPKRWPPERFAELAGQLTGPEGALAGSPVTILGSPDEQSLAQAIVSALPGQQVFDFTQQASLLQSAAILAHCALYVGNDSSQMHIAAAMGIPTLGLFGPTRAELYRPYGAAFVASDTPVEDLLARVEQERDTCLMLGLPVDKAVRAAIACLG